MNSYPFNRGMTLTPYGQFWFKKIIAGINQPQPMSLQLGAYDWDGRLFQRVQQPLYEIPINEGSKLLEHVTEQFNECSIIDEHGQTIAVSPINVSLENGPGLVESLRFCVLWQGSSLPENGDTSVSQPPIKWTDSVYSQAPVGTDPTLLALINAMTTNPYPLPTIGDTEWATELSTHKVEEFEETIGGQPKEKAPESSFVRDEPDTTIHVPIGIGVRQLSATRAAWRTPRQRLNMSLSPGIYLHIYKHTRLF